jgi:hypothetical protein
MADSITMSEFIAKVRHLGGFETVDEQNAFITDANIEERGNANLRKVFLALVRARGHDYFRAFTDITTEPNVSSYPLAANLLETLSLDRKVGDRWEEVLDFNEAERNERDYWFSCIRSGAPFRFQLRGNNIEFSPVPRTVEIFRLHYVPQFTPITRALGNSFDGVAGFEEWAVWETLAEFQAKDSSDWTLSMAKAGWWEKEVESMAGKRNAGMPKRVQRVRHHRRRDRWFR